MTNHNATISSLAASAAEAQRVAQVHDIADAMTATAFATAGTSLPRVLEDVLVELVVRDVQSAVHGGREIRSRLLLMLEIATDKGLREEGL
jgi:hypothetical protein